MEVKSGYKQTDVGVIPEPGGFGAISRWLSGATPPETGRIEFCIPEGCQRGVTISCAGRSPGGLRSLRDRFIRGRAIRGYRVAQPPANGWHPSGMAAGRVDEHLKKMGAVWK